MATIQGRKVITTAREVARFNAMWPCSPLQSNSYRHYWFEFDDDGDLVDTDVPEHEDGSAALALCEDCKRLLFDGVTPLWVDDD